MVDLINYLNWEWVSCAVTRFCAKSWYSSYCLFLGLCLFGCCLWLSHGPCVNEQILFPEININWEWHSCLLVSACVSHCCAASDGSWTWRHHWAPTQMLQWEGKGCALDLITEFCLLFNICLYFCSSLWAMVCLIKRNVLPKLEHIYICMYINVPFFFLQH